MKIVLAYSGGLDTSVLLSWIKEKYNAEMIAFCANIGQEEELKGLEKKARKTGASKIYIDDLREEFARDFILRLEFKPAQHTLPVFLGMKSRRGLELALVQERDLDASVLLASFGRIVRGDRVELAAPRRHQPLRLDLAHIL
jgi:asparagine synthetase B (glutamine-hydrolysing)